MVSCLSSQCPSHVAGVWQKFAQSVKMKFVESEITEEGWD